MRLEMLRIPDALIISNTSNTSTYPYCIHAIDNSPTSLENWRLNVAPLLEHAPLGAISLKTKKGLFEDLAMNFLLPDPQLQHPLSLLASKWP